MSNFISTYICHFKPPLKSANLKKKNAVVTPYSNIPTYKAKDHVISISVY